ncbi:MAG: hypothetical protein JWN66_1652 [Sphingomonas bacterium]|nr:hypothetical protein [Sphingomonas bacterium]
MSRLLRAFLAWRGLAAIELISAEARRDLARVRETRKLTPLLMGDASALHILTCVRAARPLGGAMAEAGVLAGGTARLIGEAKGDAALHLFDIFETLQAPLAPSSSQRESELRAHFGKVHGTQAQVGALLEAYPGVHLHPGIFPETARGLEDVRFSFVHLDLDFEPSTTDALAFFHPRMIEGGIIIGDDYHDPGVRRAFDRWFAGRPDLRLEMPWGQVAVVKAGPPA